MCDNGLEECYILLRNSAPTPVLWEKWQEQVFASRGALQQVLDTGLRDCGGLDQCEIPPAGAHDQLCKSLGARLAA